MTFNNFNLHKSINYALEQLNFSTPTEVQEASISHILQNKDLIACAKTGTGKTGAFVIPLLSKLLATPSTGYGKGPRVVIIAPTRELASQVLTVIRKLTKNINITSTLLIGGVPYQPQEKALKKELDIIVATPGRLIDHIKEGRVDFARIETVVIDEADRMLDLGFKDSINAIFDEIVTNIQTLLFSATLDNAVEKFAARFLVNPIRVNLTSKEDEHKNISQIMYKAKDLEDKRNILAHIIDNEKPEQLIIFTATKYSAENLSSYLKDLNIKNCFLHGDIKQKNRKKILSQMHDKSLKMLVATDIAARGIDIKTISHVINFDLPRSPEDYIHRIGRTGRAEKTGIAISIIGPKDIPALNKIEEMTKKRFKLKTIKL